MKEVLKSAFTKLLTVKSLVTLTLTIVFAVLSCTGVISGEQFLTIFTVIISFYFGTQVQKLEDKASTKNESENK